MIEKLEQSSGKVIGFKMSGTIDKKDYDVLVPEVEALMADDGHFNMLLDMTEFKWEKISAWGHDMKFGERTRKKVDKLAVIGDKKWQKWLTDISDPFYAHEAEFFEPAQSDQAWSWLREV